MSNTPITPQQPNSVLTRDNELLFYIDTVTGKLKIKDWKGNEDLASNYLENINGIKKFTTVITDFATNLHELMPAIPNSFYNLQNICTKQIGGGVPLIDLTDGSRNILLAFNVDGSIENRFNMEGDQVNPIIELVHQSANIEYTGYIGIQNGRTLVNTPFSVWLSDRGKPITITITNGGEDYAVNDTITLDAIDAVIRVTSIDGSSVSGWEYVSGVAAVGATVQSATSGNGTGFACNVTAVQPYASYGLRFNTTIDTIEFESGLNYAEGDTIFWVKTENSVVSAFTMVVNSVDGDGRVLTYSITNQDRIVLGDYTFDGTSGSGIPFPVTVTSVTPASGTNYTAGRKELWTEASSPSGYVDITVNNGMVETVELVAFFGQASNIGATYYIGESPNGEGDNYSCEVILIEVDSTPQCGTFEIDIWATVETISPQVNSNIYYDGNYDPSVGLLPPPIVDNPAENFGTIFITGDGNTILRTVKIPNIKTLEYRTLIIENNYALTNIEVPDVLDCADVYNMQSNKLTEACLINIAQALIAGGQEGKHWYINGYQNAWTPTLDTYIQILRDRGWGILDND
jgi:membrane-bound inhibitor of C-type lysozyme